MNYAHDYDHHAQTKLTLLGKNPLSDADISEAVNFPAYSQGAYSPKRPHTETFIVSLTTDIENVDRIKVAFTYAKMVGVNWVKLVPRYIPDET